MSSEKTVNLVNEFSDLGVEQISLIIKQKEIARQILEINNRMEVLIEPMFESIISDEPKTKFYENNVTAKRQLAKATHEELSKINNLNQAILDIKLPDEEGMRVLTEMDLSPTGLVYKNP